MTIFTTASLSVAFHLEADGFSIVRVDPKSGAKGEDLCIFQDSEPLQESLARYFNGKRRVRRALVQASSLRGGGQ